MAECRSLRFACLNGLGAVLFLFSACAYAFEPEGATSSCRPVRHHDGASADLPHVAGRPRRCGAMAASELRRGACRLAGAGARLGHREVHEPGARDVDAATDDRRRQVVPRARGPLPAWPFGGQAVMLLLALCAGAAVEYSGRCVSSGIGRRRAAGAGLRSLVERQMKLSCQSWLAPASEARARAAGPPVARASESGAPLPYPSRSRWSGASSGTPFDRHRALFG